MRSFLCYWGRVLWSALIGSKDIHSRGVFGVLIIGWYFLRLFPQYSWLTILSNYSGMAAGIIFLLDLILVIHKRHQEQENKLEQQRTDFEKRLSEQSAASLKQIDELKKKHETNTKRIEDQHHQTLKQLASIYGDEVRKLEYDLETLKDNVPSLEIHWFPGRPCLVNELDTYFCRLEIENRSTTATARDVKVELVDMDPNPIGISHVNLSREDQTDTINPESKSYFHLLTVNGTPFHRTVIITDVNKRQWTFDARIFQADILSEANISSASMGFQEYTLDIAVSASGCRPIKQKYRLTFPKSGVLVDLKLME
jgi:hypothetical protein